MAAFNPEMLILARGSRRMSQTELGRASQTSQGEISKAESGNRIPSDESVSKWASTLKYEPGLFFKNPPPPMSLTFFRKAASMSARDKAAVDANVRLRGLEIEMLARSVEMPEPTIPHEVVTSKLDPASIALRVRELWRVPRGPIPDLVTLLEDHGIIVSPIDFNADKVHGLSVSHLSVPVMFIRQDDPPDRWRFTMAHELGHMVMHHHRGMPSADVEHEANLFASEFLMPLSDIRNSFRPNMTVEHLAQLKLVWRVSMQAILKRAQSSGRITEAHATRLWRVLSARGYRLREPVEIEPETPTTLAEMLRVHRSELQYSDADMASTFSLFIEEFAALYGLHRDGHLRLIS